MASRFGEMLLNRRRELGMSIQQVANVIKIRPQIIEFFETGNFASMPPRGYAQGMIASYARYLGLNPREVVGAYFDELYLFERSGSEAGSQFTEGATNPVPRSVSTSGRYLMVDPPPIPSSRYAQRPPQAGYVSDSTSGHVPQRVSGASRRPGSLPEPGMSDQRTTALRTARHPAGSTDRTTRMPRANSSAHGRSGQGDATSLQRGRSGSARGGSGRRPPNGPGRNSGRRSQGGRRPQQSGGILNDPRILLVGLGLIVVLIVLVAVLLVRSCTTPTQAADTGSAATQAATTQDEPATDDTDASDEPATDADTDADAATTDTDDAETPSTGDAATDAATSEQTVVGISIESKVTSFLEVKLDGEIVYSAQTAGPYEEEYTPTESIEIMVSNPGDVHITKNGDKVDWDTRSGGVGRVTITVPKSETSETTDAATDGSASGDTDTDGSAAAAA